MKNNIILNRCNHKQNEIFSITFFIPKAPLFGGHLLFKFAMFDVTGQFTRDCELVLLPYWLSTRVLMPYWLSVWLSQ